MRQFRRSLGLTQEQAAAICQISREFLAQMIERTYAAFITDHSDAVVRRTLLDTRTPAPGAEIIRLPERG